MSGILLAAAAAAVAPATASAAPGATIEGHAVVRSADPALRITLPLAARYVGGERFTLYGNADCELHLFVEADAKRRVRRLYWIQFEEYLPSKPDARYTYGAHDRRMTLWGGPIWVATGVGRTERATRPGSDREHMKALLRSAGYTAPPIMMQVRMVRLLDDSAGTGYGRRELMLIYAEDLALSGESYEALGGDGDATGRWTAIEPDLVARAAAAFRLNAR